MSAEMTAKAAYERRGGPHSAVSTVASHFRALAGRIAGRAVEVAGCVSEHRSLDTMSGLFSGVHLGLRCTDAPPAF